MSTFRGHSVKGMRDLLPPETAVWSFVESAAREILGRYGYDEIRTPIVEETELFVRGVGEASEIVGKQMYTFADKKGKSLSLRPESTAAVARAYVEHGLRERPSPLRLFYIGPQFRYERPQKGRYRQFHQIGAELIGDPGPWSDVEMIEMLVTLLRALGFVDVVALVNTVGDEASRRSYTQELRAFLEPLRSELGADSRRRLEVNPLRILDTKAPRELEILEGAPRLGTHLSAEARDHFATVLAGLEACGVGYRVEDRLVRGLDYYSRTVFEIVADDLGAQNAIVGGGRYDGLIGEIGGDDASAIGFAIGLDRLIEVLPAETRERLTSGGPSLLAISIGEVSTIESLRLAAELRVAGFRVLVEMGERSLRSGLKKADRLGVSHVLLLGEDEIAAGQVTVRDFVRGEQERVSRAGLADRLRELFEGRRG